MNYKDLLQTPAYDFLHREKRLGDNIILLGLGGSHGYGTNIEGSDIDLRGVALNSKGDLIGLSSFEQYEDRATDTVVYAFMKFVRLLLTCNPNIIEILGLDEDQYLLKTDIGQELLDARHLFLSRRAAASFSGYADSQLRRLQNAIAHDTLPQSLREKHIMQSVSNALVNFNNFHSQNDAESMRLYIDSSDQEDLDTEIFLDATFHHYRLRQFNELTNTLSSVVRDYDKLTRRNRKKDESHLNKHAMHLVRLFMMGIDILQKQEIHTHRNAEELVLLRKIRKGYYMKDGVFTNEFFAIVADFEQRFKEAEKNTTLPDAPDMDAIGKFVEHINMHVIQRN